MPELPRLVVPPFCLHLFSFSRFYFFFFFFFAGSKNKQGRAFDSCSISLALYGGFCFFSLLDLRGLIGSGTRFQKSIPKESHLLLLISILGFFLIENQFWQGRRNCVCFDSKGEKMRDGYAWEEERSSSSAYA